MKTNRIWFVALLCCMFVACEKTETAPDMNVTVDDSTIQKIQNDTLVVKVNNAVRFRVSSPAPMINFFSGESGKMYKNRFRLTAEGTPKLNFSYTSRNVKSSKSDLRLLISKDFVGKNDSVSISQATWVDITPPEMLNYDSGTTNKLIQMPAVDLSAYVSDKPIFIAFRLILPSTAPAGVNPYVGTDLMVRNYLTDGSISNIVNSTVEGGFAFVTMSENLLFKKKTATGNSAWVYYGNQLMVNSVAFDAKSLGVDCTKDGKTHALWAVSKFLYLQRTKPDIGTTIQDIQKVITDYSQVYTTPGVYTATFEAKNHDETGILGSSVQEFVIKVIN